VTGTRCIPMDAGSNFSRLQAPRPWTEQDHVLEPPDTVGLASITSTPALALGVFSCTCGADPREQRASSPPAPARNPTKDFFVVRIARQQVAAQPPPRAPSAGR